MDILPLTSVTRSRRGISLIEALIVMVLVGILAAVAPRATTISGSTRSSSASSHGRHATMWTVPGFSWIRRVPACRKRKCLTALVTYRAPRSSPASSTAFSSS